MTKRARWSLIAVAGIIMIVVALGGVLAERAGWFLERGHASIAAFGPGAKIRLERGDLLVTVQKDGRTVRAERLTMPRAGVLSPRELLWEIDYQEVLRASPAAGYAFRGPQCISMVWYVEDTKKVVVDFGKNYGLFLDPETGAFKGLGEKDTGF